MTLRCGPEAATVLRGWRGGRIAPGFHGGLFARSGLQTSGSVILVNECGGPRRGPARADGGGCRGVFVSGAKS